MFQNLQYKWASLFKKNPTKWAKEEDDLLSNLIMKYDCQKIKWSEIAQSFNMVFAKDDLKKVKIGSDCRERYFNHLNPNLKKL